MTVTRVGEFGLIQRIQRLVGSSGPGVVVGMGDDCAVLEGDAQGYLLATTDIQVEGTHFRRQQLTPRQLGWRAVAINVSDVAAMGGEPRHLLVSLALPADTQVEFVERLYRGMADMCRRYGAAIVGGNVARAPEALLVDVFLLGWVPRGEVLLRSGAREGDRLLVTGALGGAAAGLALLEASRGGKPPLPPALARQLSERLLVPQPRVEAGRAIARTRLATAMIDLSDGLSSDIQHLAQRSRVGAQIREQSLPLAPGVAELARALEVDPLHWALHGGEDYELLCAAPPESVEALRRAVAATGLPLSEVGEVRPPGEGVSLERDGGQVEELEARGWDHFAGEPA